MLVLISSIWAQRTKWTLTHALIGGAQPIEGWWAPVAQPHKREVRTSGTTHEVHRRHFPTSKTLIRSERVGCSGGKHHRRCHFTARHHHAFVKVAAASVPRVLHPCVPRR